MTTEILIQQGSRHSVYTQRFAGYLANLFDPYLDRLVKEFKMIMIDAPETTQNIRRINQIIAEYKRASLSIYGEYNEDVLLAELEPFSVDESEWQVDSLKSVITSKSVEITQPNPTQIWSAINASPIVFPDSNGVFTLGPFVKEWESKQIENVSNIIRTGFITGKTTPQIVQDIAGKNGYLKNQNRNSIKTMVRTATNHVSNIARQRTNEENSDIVIGYEIVATLDSRTSNICKGYDSKVVKNTDKFKPMPPFHPNCRTTTVPVLDERYSIDESDATRSSKGVEGGRQVNADLTYYGWLKQQGEQGKNGRAFVMDILGKERGKLFLDGGLSAERFKKLTLDEHFQPIPLDELRKKKSLQLAFDKID